MGIMCVGFRLLYRYLFFFFFILRRMGKNKALAHHTRGPTPEWVGWTVTGPSPAEGHLPWPGVLLVGELAQVPHGDVLVL